MSERHLFGLDLGQAQEYTALAVAQQTMQTGGWRPVFTYAFRHLQRWPLGTSYPQLRAEVTGLLQKAPGAELVVDATGCGRAVLDMFRYADLSVPVRPVTITAGSEVMPADHGGWRVPKRDLVSAVQAALQTKRLKIASVLPETATLMRELQTFRAKVNVAIDKESFEDWRERNHDDLVLAVALAVWCVEQGGGPWEPCEPPPNSKGFFHPDNVPQGVFLPEELRLW
jgi:hypothetical protein